MCNDAQPRGASNYPAELLARCTLHILKPIASLQTPPSSERSISQSLRAQSSNPGNPTHVPSTRLRSGLSPTSNHSTLPPPAALPHPTGSAPNPTLPNPPLPHQYPTLEMGNLCGKESKSDNNFQGPGRTLGAAPPQPTKASVPARVAGPSSPTAPKIGGSGRTVGSAADASGDPRSAAAAAAEVRSCTSSRSRVGSSSKMEMEKWDDVAGRPWPKKTMMTSVWM